MNLKSFLLVGFGGFLGSIARYAFALWLKPESTSGLPISTFLVNIIGTFLLGLIAVLLSNSMISKDTSLLFAVGFCGAFTTFSTFMLEISKLTDTNGLLTAFLYIILSLILGYLFLFFGMQTGKVLVKYMI